MGKMTKFFLLFSSVLFGFFCSNIFAQNQNRIRTLDNVSQESPLIYNGTKSVDGEFLPHGWIGNCTATAVGPKAIFTAAHCIVRNGKRVRFQSRFNNKSYVATCYVHPRANQGSFWYSDYSLCKLDGQFPEDMVYASFSFRTPAIGEKMLPNGYGAPNVGTHYWGVSYVTRFSGQDIYTCRGSNLGGGDSGGSLLTWTDDRTGKSGFDIVGVNSRGGGGCSLFNKINDSQFISWSKEMEQKLSVELCGISLDCKGDPIDPNKCPVERDIVAAIMEDLKLAKENLNQCLRSE